MDEIDRLVSESVTYTCGYCKGKGCGPLNRFRPQGRSLVENQGTPAFAPVLPLQKFGFLWINSEIPLTYGMWITDFFSKFT